MWRGEGGILLLVKDGQWWKEERDVLLPFADGREEGSLV
jgi:hypothetical protein